MALLYVKIVTKNFTNNTVENIIQQNNIMSGLKKSDLKIEYTKGTGAGGQHKNKTSSCVKITHIPTGITVMKDGRNQHRNKRMALRELEKRILTLKADKRAKNKKAVRDYKIHNTPTIRTYDYKRGIVKDHRSGKEAPLKEVLQKGRVDLLVD